MLLSIALILLIGLLSGKCCAKIHLPPLVGMIAAGIVLGPYTLNLIDGSVLNVSAEIRKIALIIILIRAGLTLDISDLKKVGRPAVLMCFLPAAFEIVGMVILAPLMLGVSVLDAAIMGAVVGAVSPAVIVPRMISLIENRYGTDKGIPQLILAGASVDDVFVIVIFTALTSLAGGDKISPLSFVNIPVSLILGIITGTAVGFILTKLFSQIHMRGTVKAMIFLSAAFLLCAAEDALTSIKFPVTFSALIAVMLIGITIKKFDRTASEGLASKFNKLWICAEIFLFVLVGAAVDISYIGKAGIAAVILILGALCFRMIGVFVCLIKTRLSLKREKMIHFIAEYIIREYAMQTVDTIFGQISVLYVFGIHHKMNVRMVRCVMESRVPFHFRDRYLMRFRNLHSVSADEFTPCRRFVISKPFRVLAS